MMLFDSPLWEAVALGIEAEDMKIRHLVHHNHSRGVARESILRELMIQHAPHPFQVQTGFLHAEDPATSPPKQCDVLVYDPSKGQPYYRGGGFVIVDRRTAKLVTEVKSTLDSNTLTDMISMNQYTQPLRVPTLGFALDGYTFSNFCQEVGSRVRQNPAKAISQLPHALAVQEKNYFALRGDDQQQQHLRLVVARFTDRGMAMAYLISIFHQVLERTLLQDSVIRDWFNNRLTIVTDADKAWIDAEGNVHEGPVP